MPVELESYRKLFTSVWAASHSRLLNSNNTSGPSSTYHFLSALIDCLVLSTIRLNRVSPDDAKTLAVEEITRIWNDGVLVEAGKMVRMDRSMMGEMRIESVREAGMVGKAMSRLAKENGGELVCHESPYFHEIDQLLFDGLLDLADRIIDATCEAVEKAFSPSDQPNTSAQSILVGRLGAIRETLVTSYEQDDRLSVRLDAAIAEISKKAIACIGREETEQKTREDYLKLVLRMLKTRGDVFRQDEDLAQVRWREYKPLNFPADNSRSTRLSTVL